MCVYKKDTNMLANVCGINRTTGFKAVIVDKEDVQTKAPQLLDRLARDFTVEDGDGKQLVHGGKTTPLGSYYVLYSTSSPKGLAKLSEKVLSSDFLKRQSPIYALQIDNDLIQ